MAWNERLKQMRRLQAIHDNIDNDLAYLKEFSDLYSKDHAPLAGFAEAIAGVLIEVQTQVLKLREQL